MAEILAEVFDRHNFMKAAEKILQQVTVNREYDIPFVAGYSTDGKAIYIDRDLVRLVEDEGRYYEIQTYVALHEVVEKLLIDTFGLEYREAHAVANHLDRGRILLDGCDPQVYLTALGTAYKGNRATEVLCLPANLDMTPYEASATPELLARMRYLLPDPCDPQLEM